MQLIKRIIEKTVSVKSKLAQFQQERRKNSQTTGDTVFGTTVHAFALAFFI